MKIIESAARFIAGSLVVSTIAACGGAIGLFGSDSIDEDTLLTWEENVFIEKSAYKDLCANPRSGTDPYNNNRPYPDKQGSVAYENFFLRSWTNDLYLWYDEVEDQDPNLFETAEYFRLLKTQERNEAGDLKDNFHFTQDSADYLDRTVGGRSFGFGFKLRVPRASPPREYRIIDVVPGSSADLAGVERGMLIASVDGADLINGNDTATLNAGLFPSEEGEEHVFILRPYDSDSGGEEFVLTSGNVSAVPVKDTTVVETEDGSVGYIHFNSHILPAELGLFNAFSELEEAGVRDLVLDLRYNGGGALSIASQVSYMIAGATQVEGQFFYRLQFNDKYTSISPFSGSAIQSTPFYANSFGYTDDLPPGVGLPTLDLERVYILSTGGTCSASETIINGLRGIGVDVFLIGTKTCGKPYGFVPQGNCGTHYFSIQFSGINNQGFGEYSEGFTPVNAPAGGGVPIPGCWVEDEYSKALGDPEDALFAAVLQHRIDGTCPALPEQSEKSGVDLPLDKTGADLILPPEPPSLNNTLIFLD